MKITKGLIQNLLRLASGETVPSSSLKSFKEIDEMRADGVLTVVAHGSRRSYKCTDTKQFRDYLASKYNFTDLEGTFAMLEKEETSRAEQVQLTGDSKFVRSRAMKGFLVNSYEPINAMLNNSPFEIQPPEGSYAFIYDYENFSIPEDVLVMGIENSENFRRIRQQQWLFNRMYPGRRILFVSRYPQNESHDLIKWLAGIQNEYVHFGDLDLAGIRIFLTEFHRYLGRRSSFLIPPDYETRISNGNRERYDAQLPYAKQLTTDNPNLQQLIECIHKYHRGYDQEGFCIDE